MKKSPRQSVGDFCFRAVSSPGGRPPFLLATWLSFFSSALFQLIEYSHNLSLLGIFSLPPFENVLLLYLRTLYCQMVCGASLLCGYHFYIVVLSPSFISTQPPIYTVRAVG